MNRRLFATIWGSLWTGTCKRPAGNRQRGEISAITIPAMVTGNPDQSALDLPPAWLLMTTDGEEQQPLGPAAFDILANGEFAIADPLRRRIAFFDANGQYLREWVVGFAVDSLSEAVPGRLHVRRAVSGTLHASDGNSVSAPLPLEPLADFSATGEPNRRTILLRRPGATIRIESASGVELIGAKVVGSDSGSIYVQVESIDAGTLELASRRVVQKYGKGGAMTEEFGDFDAEQYIPVQDDIRAKDSRICQLVTRPGKIIIKSRTVARV